MTDKDFTKKYVFFEIKENIFFVNGQYLIDFFYKNYKKYNLITLANIYTSFLNKDNIFLIILIFLKYNNIKWDTICFELYKLNSLYNTCVRSNYRLIISSMTLMRVQIWGIEMQMWL